MPAGSGRRKSTEAPEALPHELTKSGGVSTAYWARTMEPEAWAKHLLLMAYIRRAPVVKGRLAILDEQPSEQEIANRKLRAKLSRRAFEIAHAAQQEAEKLSPLRTPSVQAVNRIVSRMVAEDAEWSATVIHMEANLLPLSPDTERALSQDEESL